MNWGLSAFPFVSAVPFAGHSNGIPTTTGGEEPGEDEGGETGSIEPLATTLMDAGLVMDAGTVTVLAPFGAAAAEKSEPAEPIGVAD